MAAPIATKETRDLRIDRMAAWAMMVGATALLTYTMRAGEKLNDAVGGLRLEMVRNTTELKVNGEHLGNLQDSIRGLEERLRAVEKIR